MAEGTSKKWSYHQLIEKISEEFSVKELEALRYNAEGAGLPHGTASECQSARDILKQMTRKGILLKDGDVGKLEAFLRQSKLYSHVQKHFESFGLQHERGSMLTDASPTEPRNSGDPLSYPIREGQRGYCIFIENFTQERSGSANDSSRLDQFFRNDLKYYIEKRRNLSKEGINKFLEQQKDILRDNHQNYDKLIMVIMSHGQKEGIKTCTRQGTLETEEVNGVNRACLTSFDDIIDPFKDVLHNKPKVFLFQCCLGEEQQQYILTTDSNPEQRGESEPFDQGDILLIPRDADILIGFPTQPGNPAHRRENVGTWFIQTLIDIFKKYHTTEDVVSMLTIVNKEVGRKTGDNNEKQMPIFHSTLRYKAWLK